MSGRKPKPLKNKKQNELDPLFAYDGSTPLPNNKQELFCQLYASNSTPAFFGNGLRCYMFSYGYQERHNKLQEDLIGARTTTGRGKNRKMSDYDTIKRKMFNIEGTCKVEASRLLTYPHVLARGNHLMDILIEDKIVDRELAFVIQQRGDLSSKTQAIVHYDKKKGRLVEKQEQLHKFEPVTAVTFIFPDGKKTVKK